LWPLHHVGGPVMCRWCNVLFDVVEWSWTHTESVGCWWWWWSWWWYRKTCAQCADCMYFVFIAVQRACVCYYVNDVVWRCSSLFDDCVEGIFCQQSVGLWMWKGLNHNNVVRTLFSSIRQQWVHCNAFDWKYYWSINRIIAPIDRARTSSY